MDDYPDLDGKAVDWIEKYPSCCYDLIHFWWSGGLGHLAGEGCPCRPVRKWHADE